MAVQQSTIVDYFNSAGAMFRSGHLMHIFTVLTVKNAKLSPRKPTMVVWMCLGVLMSVPLPQLCFKKDIGFINRDT